MTIARAEPLPPAHVSARAVRRADVVLLLTVDDARSLAAMWLTVLTTTSRRCNVNINRFKHIFWHAANLPQRLSEQLLSSELTLSCLHYRHFNVFVFTKLATPPQLNSRDLLRPSEQPAIKKETYSKSTQMFRNAFGVLSILFKVSFLAFFKWTVACMYYVLFMLTLLW